MNRTPAAAWSLLFAAILGCAVFFAEAPHARQDDGAVQAAVETQLQALAQDDAGKAFAMADPALRTRFGSPQEFMSAVRTQYPMVANPASVLFLQAESDGTIALQKVRITDTEGASWMVTYLLNRQGDDRWLISGCLVAPDGHQVTT